MTRALPETITVRKAILDKIDDGVAVAGRNRLDDHGRWILGLGLEDADGDRDIDVLEGETFEFAGATWTVTKVFEPNLATRGAAGILTRVV